MEYAFALNIFNIDVFKVKRTSLWNKAGEELRKHQEFINKVQQNPEFLKEPFGDPFSGEDLKAQLGAGEDSEDSDSEDDITNHQEDLDMTPGAIKERNQQQQNSIPFYSDGEEDDTDGEDIKTKSQKLDLKKRKSQKLSSLNSSSYDAKQHQVANGSRVQQNQTLPTATKTAPPPLVSPGPLIQSPSLISPQRSGTNKGKKDEKSTKDKKMSKKKQKEIHQQQQVLLAEAAAKANAGIVRISPIIAGGVDAGGKGDDTINDTSSKKKRRGRPKKNKPEESHEQGKNLPAGQTPSQQSLISSMTTTSSQVSFSKKFQNVNPLILKL